MFSGRGRDGLKNGNAVGHAIDTIEHQTVQMNIEIGGGAKALDEGDRPGLSLGMGQAGLVNHKGGEDPVNDLQHGREQVRLTGKQMLQGDGKGHHPLTHGHMRDDPFHQMGRGLGHASGATRRAKPAPFAREGHQLLMGAVPTAQAQKPMRENAAFQKRLELVFDKLRQACPGFLFDWGEEGVEMLLDGLVERGLLGTAAFAGSRCVIGGRRAGRVGRRGTAC